MLSNIKHTQFYLLTRTTKATFCPIPMCFHYWQPCICNRLGLHLSSLKLRQTKYTTGDSCDGGISVLNHCLTWSKFVNTDLYHSRQWFNVSVANWWLSKVARLFLKATILSIFGVSPLRHPFPPFPKTALTLTIIFRKFSKNNNFIKKMLLPGCEPQPYALQWQGHSSKCSQFSGVLT